MIGTDKEKEETTDTEKVYFKSRRNRAVLW